MTGAARHESWISMSVGAHVAHLRTYLLPYLDAGWQTP